MDSKVQPKLMFFNDEWSVGKVLDAVADAGSIDNLNNKMGEEVRACFLPLAIALLLYSYFFFQRNCICFRSRQESPFCIA